MSRINSSLTALIREYEQRSEIERNQILDFHVRFEEIFPFEDGNGRVGRLIMFKECLRHGTMPFIIDDKRWSRYLRGIKEWHDDRYEMIDVVMEAQGRFEAQIELQRLHRSRPVLCPYSLPGGLVKLKALLSKLIIAPPVDFVSDDSNMREFASEPGLRCETGTLALAKNTVGSILITDDQFLACAASFFGIDNAGMTFLISKLGLGAAKMVDASRKLKELNFQNYLPFGLYKSIFDKLDEGNEGSKDGERLGAWLLGDQEVASNRHKEIVIELYRDVVQAREDYLNPSNILGQLAIRYYESMHPGFIEALVRDAMKDLRIEIVQDGTSADSAATE